MFVLQQPRPMPWNQGDAVSPVISYYDARGNRYFFIRPQGEKYDIRLVVQDTVTANRPAISGKQVEVTARTLGIHLPETDLIVLAQSTLRARAAR